MRIVKKIFFFLLAIVAVALIVALFVKKDYSVVREVSINKPRQQIFDYLRLLKNQDSFLRSVLPMHNKPPPHSLRREP